TKLTQIEINSVDHLVAAIVQINQRDLRLLLCFSRFVMLHFDLDGSLEWMADAIEKECATFGTLHVQLSPSKRLEDWSFERREFR
ncbi:hypothetical protein PFISCL1PPCAC_12246, partial [Pristionchus fissidentatus]